MTEPRTILQVGNFTKPWCSEWAFRSAFETLGHTVVPLQENELAWADVPRLAVEHGAHLLVWTRTWPAAMDEVVPVLDRLREMGVPSASMHLDRWFGLDREHQVDDQPFFRTDLVVSPDDSPRWVEHGVNHMWLPPGVHGGECGVVEPDRRRFPHDVVFVGSHPYPHPEWEPYRSELIATFQKRFGARFRVWPDRHRPLRGRDLQTLYATAKVVIGDSCLAGESHRYWSDRIPETLGRGALLIHPGIPGHVGPGGDWYVDGEHLLTYLFGDFKDAVMQAELALEKPELVAPIAKGGRALVLGRDLYEHRMAALLEEVERQFGWRDIGHTPTEIHVASSHEPTRTNLDVHLHGFRGRFMVEQGSEPGDTASVVNEVWAANDYRIGREGLSGTVLDIGGNVGAFAVLAAKAGAEGVVSVEPHPGNRARLEHHLTINGLWPHTSGPLIQIDPRAVVADAQAIPRLALVGNGGGAHTATIVEAADGPWGEVYTVSLATLIEQLAPISFLKCDIEGGEYGAFSGVTAHLLHDSVERIALEYHGPGMPHLAHLDADGRHLERWGALVALLADCGHLEIHGHPMVGGLLHWKRF